MSAGVAPTSAMVSSAQLVAVVDQRLVELLEAADAQLGVGRPIGRVEGAPRRGDGGLGVG